MTEPQFKKLMKKLDEISGNIVAYESSGDVQDLTREVAGLKKTLDKILDELKKRN